MKARHRLYFSRLIRAAAAIVLLPSAAFSFDVVKTWDYATNSGGAPTNNNFFQVQNWNGDTRPDFLPGGDNDRILFAGAGTGVTIPLNVNGTQSAYELKSWTFTAGTYTFNNTQNVILGDTTSKATNTGWLINSGTGTITFNNTSVIGFRFGGIDASGGPVTLGSGVTLNIGFDLTGAANNVTIQGSSTVTVNGLLTGLGDDSLAGGNLIKSGSNHLLLNGNSSAWNGRIGLLDGVIRANKANSLGSAAGRTVIAGDASTARVEVLGGIAISEPFFLAGRATGNLSDHLRNTSGGNILAAPVLTLDAGGTEFGLQSDAGTFSIASDIAYGTASGPVTLHIGGAGDGAFTGNVGIGGKPLSIAKTGAGTWTLGGANAYTGNTTISAGRLNLTTARTGAGGLAVEDGATLGLTLAAAGQSLNSTTTILGTTTGSTLAIDLGSFGSNPTVPVIAAGALTLNGTSTIHLKAGGLSVGQFPLISYSSLSGTGTLALGSVPARVTATLVDDVAHSRVLLNVASFDVPRWTGAVDAVWDLDDGTGTGTTNWRELISGALTRYLQGSSGIDAVRFDDTATGSTDINLSTTLTPASVLVLNEALNYTFIGAGKLSGPGSLTKQGTGKLTLLNTGGNDFTGTTTISGGVIQVGDGLLAAGGSLGTGPVVNNTLLVLNRPDAYTLPGAISGSGNIQKLGAGITTLSGASTFDGVVNVDQGTLRLGSGLALGSTSAGTFVKSGTTLELNGQQVPQGEIVTVEGTGADGTGAVTNVGTGNSGVGIKNLVLSGPATIGGSARWDVRDSAGGVAVNGFDLVKDGSNSVYFANVGETGIGNLTVKGSASRLVFEGDSTFGSNSGVITVETSAQLGLENSTAAHTKPVSVFSGTIRVSGGINTLGSPVAIDTVATLDVANNAELIITGKVSGNGNLIKTTGGIAKFVSNTSDYAGVTQISAGQLWIGDDTTTGHLPEGEIINNNALHLRRTDTALVVPNIISGTGNVVLGNNSAGLDTQTATLTGLNTFTGAVNINRGFLRITNSSALGVGPKVVGVQSNKRPTLVLNGSAGDIVLDSSISYNTSSDGTAGAFYNEAGHNTIAGTVNLRNGSGGNTRVYVESGSLALTGPILAAADATSARTLILDGVGPDNRVDGVLSNGTTQLLTLNKAGAGTWTLNAVNTYTGATSITAGTLKIGATGSIATSPTIDIAADAQFDVGSVPGGFALNLQTLSGWGTVAGGISAPAGSVVSPAGATGAGTLTFQGGLTLSGGKVQTGLDLDIPAVAPASDLVAVTGDLNITAPSTIEIRPTGTPLAGSYPVITYTGTLNGNVGDLSLVNTTRYTPALDLSTPGQVGITFTGAFANLVWSGNGTTNTWDQNSANNNWNTGTEHFFPVDAVRFDDTSLNTTVALSGQLIPSSVVVDAASSYTFSGSGSITGTGSLFKSGTGVLALTGSHSFTGKTKISGGSLVLGTGGRLTGTRWIEVDAGAIFDASAVTAGFTLGGIVDPRVLSGRGTINGLFIVSNASVIKPGDSSDPSDIITAGSGVGTLTFGSDLTLTGAATPGVPRAVLTVGGTSGHVADPLDLAGIVAFDGVVPANSDYLFVTGAFKLDAGSLIKVELASGYTPQLGDVINLVDFASSVLDTNATGGAFDPASDLDLPALPPGLGWNRSLFGTNGILFVDVAAPVLDSLAVAPASTVNPGTVVTFSINVTGVGPYSYVWKKNGAPINGETGSTLSFTASEASEATYSVSVGNQSGATGSSTVSLVVNDPVHISSDPVSRTVNPGAQVSFTVAATGTAPLTYQWRKNGEPLEGETSDTLSIASVNEADEASYDVLVGNITGQTPSAPAALLVNNPVQITAPLQSQVALVGGEAVFSVTASGTAPITYQWRRNSAPLQGATSATLTLSPITINSAGDYDVVITNTVNSVTSTPVALEVISGTTPRIVGQPASKLAATGAPVEFSVLAVAAPPVKYQWLKNGKPVAGATASIYRIPAAALSHAGAYSVAVTSTTTTTSNVAELGVVTQTTSSQTLAGNANVTIKAATAGNSLTYAWQKDGEPLPSNSRFTISADQKTLAIKTAEAADEGDYQVLVTGPGGTLSAGVTTLKVFLEQPKILTPVEPPDATVSGTYYFKIPVDTDTTKAPTSFAVTGLPAGLKFNTKTGEITGKPTASRATAYALTIKATNSKGTDKTTASLNVSALPSGAAGAFVGPIPRSALSNDLGGRLELSTLATGVFSGKLFLGSASLPFKGVLDATVGSSAPTATVTVTSKTGAALTLSFTIDGNADRLSAASVTDGTTTTSFTAWRNKWKLPATPAADYAGYYTFGLQIPETGAGTEQEGLPQGNGFGSLTIKPAGTLAIAGKLADGEKLTFSTFVGPEGEVLLFQIFFSGKGSIVGSLDITPVPAPASNTLDGALSWSRPFNTGRIGGFNAVPLTAIGGRYNAPVAPTLVLGITDGADNAKVDFLEAEVPSSPSIVVSLKTGNKVSYPAVNTAKTALVPSAATGAFKGSFSLSDPNPWAPTKPFVRNASYEGIIVPTSSGLKGYGYFLLARLPTTPAGTVLTTPQLSGQAVFSPVSNPDN